MKSHACHTQIQKFIFVLKKAGFNHIDFKEILTYENILDLDLVYFKYSVCTVYTLMYSDHTNLNGYYVLENRL